MNCKMMLQSAFDWANRGVIGGGEFPNHATVFATVTLHQASDRVDKHSDFVWYGNGAMSVRVKNGQEILMGNLPSWVNNVSEIFIPPTTQAGEIAVSIDDLFPNSPSLGLLLTVDHTGTITIGKLIKGNLLAGLPPSSFQATCDKELLTGSVDVFGEAICTVSLSLGSSIQ